MNCRRTRRTRHAPHLDLSPIFPLKYKTQTKIPRASRGRDAPSGRDRITFSFWELVPLWLDRGASRRWRLACVAMDRACGVMVPGFPLPVLGLVAAPPGGRGGRAPRLS